MSKSLLISHSARIIRTWSGSPCENSGETWTFWRMTIDEWEFASADCHEWTIPIQTYTIKPESRWRCYCPFFDREQSCRHESQLEIPVQQFHCWYTRATVLFAAELPSLIISMMPHTFRHLRQVPILYGWWAHTWQTLFPQGFLSPGPLFSRVSEKVSSGNHSDSVIQETITFPGTYTVYEYNRHIRLNLYSLPLCSVWPSQNRTTLSLASWLIRSSGVPCQLHTCLMFLNGTQYYEECLQYSFRVSNFHPKRKI